MTAATPPAGGAQVARQAFRPEIQALRALAVLLVVVFHLESKRLTGGYVGVDVFFVISGYLITSHLVRETESSGRLSLRRFYARRIRRLIPAACLVLLAVAVAALVWVPASQRPETLRELIASALYFENWVLAGNAVDYLGADLQATALQHFWSLSVEEQFYLVWPVILIVAAAATRHRSATVRRRTFAVVLGVIFAGSLAFSVVITAVDPASAYFVTPARAWEFAAGGLVALIATRMVGALGDGLRAVASWIGVALIVVSAVAFTGATPFPGILAAVPVAGAALVIAAGDPARRWSPLAVGRLRPVQYLGDISYSVYLWHWPLIVFYPFVVGHAPGIRGVLLIALLTVVLAALTRRFVEKPFIAGRARGGRVWSAYAIGAVSMALVVALSLAQIVSIDRAEAAARSAAAQELKANPCFGAKALQNPDRCPDPLRAPGTIDTAFASHDYADTTLGDCGAGSRIGQVGDSPECGFGSAAASTTVVVIGDSHGGQWLPAVQAIGAARGWHTISMVRSSCPFTTAPVSANGQVDAACQTWKSAVLAAVKKLHPDLVVVASLVPFGYRFAGIRLPAETTVTSGYTATLTALKRSAREVVVLKDTPYMEVNIPSCLETATDPEAECSRPEATVLTAHDDPLWTAAARVRGVTRIDLTRDLCVSSVCYPVIGGVVVYRDHHHLSASYSRSLSGPLLAAMRSGLAVLP